jgi:hypothetical protein
VTVYSPCGRESEIVADVDGELIVVKQLDDEARPLVRTNGDCPVCLSDITNSCLGTWWEVVDDETDGVKSAPSARVRIGIDGVVDRRDSRGGGAGERKIMDRPELARLSRLRNPRERGRLEGANEGFDLEARARTDVTAFPELIGHHLMVGIHIGRAHCADSFDSRARHSVPSHSDSRGPGSPGISYPHRNPSKYGLYANNTINYIFFYGTM